MGNGSGGDGSATAVTGESELPPVAVDDQVREADERRWTPRRIIVWTLIALLGGVSWTMIAIVRGETVNAIWFVFAAVCTYFIAHRSMPSSSNASC